MDGFTLILLFWLGFMGYFYAIITLITWITTKYSNYLEFNNRKDSDS